MLHGEPVDNESDDVTDTEWDGSGSGDGECRMHHVFIFQLSACNVVYRVMNG